ncbi:hypothetical protein ACHAXA_011615 [Cyclostephanos tholiformis]|uniref:MICOS complex subunit MIC10 n=1 Tax=Cyclostephanos tholiformis TaxID=382380 RepID=A0ABD3RV85_9STRA
MTSSSSSSSSSSSDEEKERKAKLAQCLLGQYRYCAGGVVVGAGYSVLTRSSSRPVGPWPMLAGGFAGTLGDFAYGYFVECAHLRAERGGGGGGGATEKCLVFRGVSSIEACADDAPKTTDCHDGLVYKQTGWERDARGGEMNERR